jgi:diguanylate cyclase (GGDEF)-like protein
MTSRLLLTYAERAGGRGAVHAILRAAGCAHREAELVDEGSWFSFATKVALFEAAADVLDDAHVMRHAGAAALDLSVGDGLKVALRALGSPRLVYRNIVRANGKFSAVHSMDVRHLGRDSATITFADTAGYGVHPLDCDYNTGLLSVVPVLFGLRPARVSHTQCAARGAEACVYELTWDPAAVTRRHVTLTASAALASTGAAALAAPALVPVAAGASAVAGGVLAWRQARDRRESRRLLELELKDRDESTRRFTESLQNLVSALDLEEVLQRTVDNAHAAVAGKQFLLLAGGDDGERRCRASTGVDPHAIATVEAWAARQPPAGAEPRAVEDVRTLPALASLAGHPTAPAGSLCLAPLVFRGAELGHLVALAPQARTFLPRDIDLVSSYAVQAAIALANARDFAAQRALASRDSLTGLLNHREFHESIERELERGRRHGGSFGVALLDLDGFKLVNDGAGHAEGDRVLRGVAEALASTCRASDMAFRIGGDEFALLLPGTGAGEGAAVVDRVRAAVATVDARVSTSVGLATWPADGGSKDVLLAHADAVLYSMKSAAGRRAASRAAAADAGDRAAAGALHRERLAMASRLSARLAPLMDADAIVRSAVDELHLNFDYRVAYAMRVEGAELRAVALGGSLTHTYDVPLWRQRLEQGISGRVARTGVTALVHDTRLDPDHLDAHAVKPGIDVRLRSQIAVPLRVDGAVWGVLAIQDTEPGIFTSDDVLLVETVAAQVAAALERTAILCRLDDGELERLRRDCAGPESLHS